MRRRNNICFILVVRPSVSCRLSGGFGFVCCVVGALVVAFLFVFGVLLLCSAIVAVIIQAFGPSFGPVWARRGPFGSHLGCPIGQFGLVWGPLG